MAGENEQMLAALQELVAGQQASGPGPIITPQSYSATLQAYFGTTNWNEAFAGYPAGVGEKFPVAVPDYPQYEVGEKVPPGLEIQDPNYFREQRADQYPASAFEGSLGRNPDQRQAYLDPIMVTGATTTESGGEGRYSYVVNPENGAMLYADGTIVDPNTAVAIIRPGETGSALWLRTEVPKWDQARIDKWRKELFEQGYSVEKEGSGVDDQFLSALFSYHQNRYLNGGEIVPLLSPEQMKMRATETRKESFSRAEARNAVRSMYQRQFAEDPSDAELEDWTEWFVSEGTKMARKGFTGDQLFTRAAGKATDTFLSDPAVKAETRDREENEYAGAAFERFFQAMGSLE